MSSHETPRKNWLRHMRTPAVQVETPKRKGIRGLFFCRKVLVNSEHLKIVHLDLVAPTGFEFEGALRDVDDLRHSTSAARRFVSALVDMPEDYEVPETGACIKVSNLEIIQDDGMGIALFWDRMHGGDKDKASRCDPATIAEKREDPQLLKLLRGTDLL